MDSQKKYSFDSETLKKIGRGALIALGGAAGTEILRFVSGANFGNYTPLIVAGTSILINSIREYIKGELNG